MPASFPVRILTPMGEVADADAVYVRVTAVDGQVGVMARHAPMVTRLAIGTLVLTDAGGASRHFAIVEGVMRVRPDGVVVLVEAAEEAAEIDIGRAQRALERARTRLSTLSREELDAERARLALARARNRLEVAGQPPG